MKAVLKVGQRQLDLITEYTGHPYDPVLGIYYARARMYDAADRRFMAVDLVKGWFFDPATLVQYTYCLDNPIIYVDPYGKDATELPYVSITGTDYLHLFVSRIKSDSSNYFAILGCCYIGLPTAPRPPIDPDTESSIPVIFGDLRSLSDVAQAYIRYYARLFSIAISDQEQASATTKAKDIIKLDAKKRIIGFFHDVPLIKQENTNICWAYAQVMIEAYYTEGGMTDDEATNRAEEIAKLVKGEVYWDRGGFPTNSPDVISTPGVVYTGQFTGVNMFWQECNYHIVNSHKMLLLELEVRPIYGYYSNYTKPGITRSTDHLVIITGAMSAPMHPDLVTSNNPWGDKNVQTYEDFLSGVPRDKNDMKLVGILRVNSYE